MSRNSLVVMFMVTTLVACAAQPRESKQVKGVIMQYTALLAEGYKKMNMNPLQQVATETVATKAYYHMAALGEGKVRLVSVLKDVAFKNVAFPTPDRATVTTREIWDFTHTDIASGKTVLEEKGFPYEITYELQKDGGLWKISNVLAMSEEHSSSGRPASSAGGNSAAIHGAAPPAATRSKH